MVKTQTEAVLNHLKEKGTITSMEAIANYNATRLSDIILRLRTKHVIDMVMCESKHKNQFGKTSRYGMYIYKGEINE
jgi:NADPH-dependent curcumin reductase CurA